MLRVRLQRAARTAAARAADDIVALPHAQVLITLLFLTPWFYYLPNCALASIILSSVIGLFDHAEARYVHRIITAAPMPLHRR